MSPAASTGSRVGVIWARASDDKGQDAEGQVRELSALATRMGIHVPPEFVFKLDKERAGSVWKGDPPEKAEVLELARRRKFDVLFIWALDRWSRRRVDGAREIFETLPAYGVRVVSLEESFLSTEGMNDGLRAIVGQLMLWLAEEDSKRKSRRVRLKYETNRNRAANVGAKAKWGRGYAASAEERARILELAKEGKSHRAIERETGVPRSTVQRIVGKQDQGVAQSSRTEADDSSP